MNRPLIALCLVTTTALSAAGQRSIPNEMVLEFTAERIEDVREGYFTLQWNDLPAADFYRVLDGNEMPVYQGVMNEAFISGLTDGTYSFHVLAVDESGTTIAASGRPATVVVQHWPLTWAMNLLVVGFIVVLVILGVIVLGAFGAGRNQGHT